MKHISLLFFIIFIIIGFIYYASMKWLAVNEIEIKFKNLPDNLDGFTILQISDLHSNSKHKMNVDIWKKIETLDFDIAVITGDLTRANFEFLKPHYNGFRNLAKSKPVFFITGNHDKKYFKQIKRIFDEFGIKILDNESILLKDFELELIGYRDCSFYIYDNLSYKPPIIKRKNNAAFSVALFHQPQVYDLLNEKPDLAVCGHTHGGQIRLPFLPVLYAPGQGFLPKYGMGLYELPEGKLFVSKGVGTTIFPVRLFNRPEIAVITLRKK